VVIGVGPRSSRTSTLGSSARPALLVEPPTVVVVSRKLVVARVVNVTVTA
jgi:hypothetical protein